MTPAAYCRERTRRAQSSFYYPLLLLPTPQRQAMYALYAYCREVDDAVDQASDPQAATAQLAAWRQRLAQLLAGQPDHPITQALGEARQRFNLPAPPLTAILEGVTMDLHQSRYATLADLEAYSRKVAVAVGEWTVRILGLTPPLGDILALHLGLAMQYTNILRDLREDAARHRIYLPQNFLADAGVTETDLLNGHDSPALTAACQRLADIAEAHYQLAASLAAGPGRAGRPIRMMAGIYHAYLDRLRQQGFALVPSPPIRLSRWEKWRILRQCW